jgi:flagellar motor switch protein FliM
MAVGGKNLSRNNRTLSYDNIPELLTDSTTESADSEKLKTYGRTDNVNELKEEIAQLKRIMDKYKSLFKAQVTQVWICKWGWCVGGKNDLDM